MIKRVRIKFIVINMVVLFVLMLAIFFGSYLYMEKSSSREIKEFLDILIEQDGVMTILPTPEEDPFAVDPEMDDLISTTPIKWFSIKLDQNDQVIESNDRLSSLDENTVQLYLSTVLQSNKTSDKIEGFRYQMVETSYGKLVVFADQRIQNGMLESLLGFIHVITVVSFLVLLIITICLSALVVKPVKEAFEKQKLFIADSGHELKTPLTIISANVHMLEQEMGESKYANEIKNQTKRMNRLVTSLLTLAKTEAIQEKQKTSFDLSKLAQDHALQFELLIYEMNKTLSLDVAHGCHYVGCKEDIKTLFTILIDNAVKYSKEQSTIQIRLFEQKRKKVIEIRNQCESIDNQDIQHVFDRFYRLDHSRSRDTGGYGIGLSIAKNIVQNHRGKITAKVEQGTTMVMTVIL